MNSDELDCWLNCYGAPLVLGLKVKPTCFFKGDVSPTETFYITSISFGGTGVNIGVNNGDPNSFKTVMDNIGIDELELVNQEVA